VAGLYDGLKFLNANSSLIGFLDGSKGLLENRSLPLSLETLAGYRNTGGFDLLGSARIKIETPSQLAAAKNTVERLGLDGLVVIGGDDSNTNVAILAEHFLQEKCTTRVIGVPKTIDGDIQNAYLHISFGFDTASKIYSEMIGNIARDALSSKKYTHIIKVMGRSASHIALECALKTHPNLTLISEEVAAQEMTLSMVVQKIVTLIGRRAKSGKNYNVIVIPEGIIEAIEEVRVLISELHYLLQYPPSDICAHLSEGSAELFASLPERFQQQLLQERDSHGNFPLSHIEIESLLAMLVEQECKEREIPVHLITHFFGYEGRSGFPTNFDCHFCTALGYTAALILDEGLTGYMATVQGLEGPYTEWTVSAVPIVQLLQIEERASQRKPVMRKSLVDLCSPQFTLFEGMRQKWEVEDDYQCPGPIQFYGEEAVTDDIPMILDLLRKRTAL
jgi:pyrophosphate--fructose-6-phosphate 1-phosphotransferase